MTDTKPNYAQINRKVWNTCQFRSLSDEAKFLFFYLTTCPHGNMLGIYILRPGYALADLGFGMDQKRLMGPMQELIDRGLFKYDAEKEIVLDREHISKHPPENPNQVKACLGIVKTLPKSPLFQDLIDILKRLNKPIMQPLIEGLTKRLGEGLPKGLGEGLPKGLGEGLGKPVTVTVTGSVSGTGSVTGEDNIPAVSDDGPVPYQQIIEYLNFKTGKKFNHRTKATREKIKARWNDNGTPRTIDDFKQVIDNKCKEWLLDSKMVNYLRPETLFGTKFESYLNEVAHPLAGKVSDVTLKNINMLNDWRPPKNDE